MASKIVVVPPAPTLQSLQKELSQLKNLLPQKNSGPAQRAGSVVSFASQDNLLITEGNNARTVTGAPPTVSSLLTIIPKNMGQCSIGLVPSVRHKCTPSPRKFSNG